MKGYNSAYNRSLTSTGVSDLSRAFRKIWSGTAKGAAVEARGGCRLPRPVICEVTEVVVLSSLPLVRQQERKAGCTPGELMEDGNPVAPQCPPFNPSQH